MRFKLILAFVEDSKTDVVLDAARNAGATGATVINNARGEGLNKKRTFFGLTLEVQKDVVLLMVEEHLSRHIWRQSVKWASLIRNPGRASLFKSTLRML